MEYQYRLRQPQGQGHPTPTPIDWRWVTAAMNSNTGLQPRLTPSIPSDGNHIDNEDLVNHLADLVITNPQQLPLTLMELIQRRLAMAVVGEFQRCFDAQINVLERKLTGCGEDGGD